MTAVSAELLINSFQVPGKILDKVSSVLSFLLNTEHSKQKQNKTHKVNDVYKNSLFYLSGELTLDLKHSTKKTR